MVLELSLGTVILEGDLSDFRTVIAGKLGFVFLFLEVEKRISSVIVSGQMVVFLFFFFSISPRRTKIHSLVGGHDRTPRC